MAGSGSGSGPRVAWLFQRPLDSPAIPTSARITLSGARDAQGPVDLSAPGPQGWRSGAEVVHFLAQDEAASGIVKKKK